MIKINNNNIHNQYPKQNINTNHSDTVYIPPPPPPNGAIIQSYDVQRNIYINIAPESDGNMSVDVISPKDNKILEHHCINPMEVQPSNASYLEMLALEQHLFLQGKCEQGILSGVIGTLYENEELNTKANYLEELKYSVDNLLKYTKFEDYIKNRQATYAILDWKPQSQKI